MPSIVPSPRFVITGFALAAVLLVAPGALLSQDTATSQGASPYVELPQPPDEQTCIQEGVVLEQSGRWIAAIEHYEKALKSFPKSAKLKYGLRRARIHFGIHRRYSDASFERDMLAQSTEQALATFDKVYNRVRASYFEPISITSFTAHGTESFYLALSNEKFLENNVPNADPRQIAEVRRVLRDSFWNRNVEGSGAAHRTIREACQIAQSRLGLEPTAVIMEYVFGGCNALDVYSNYLTPDRLDDLYGNIDGEFVGLGIEMRAEQGHGILLLDVLPNSPAATGGMRPGEYIVAINGVDCRTMTTDEAARLLRGPSGSSVKLKLLPSTAIAKNPTPWKGRFVRRPVVVKSIENVRMLDNAQGIGYLRLTGFQRTTAEELDAAMASLSRQGMQKLIIDLRGNPGGLLTAAVEVLDRFISQGVLVSTKGRNLDQNWTYTAHADANDSDIPLVVLIDGNSASASEIVSGAMRDHHRATLVGRTSYGKWCVQTIMPMVGETGLRLTTALFYSPDGHNYTDVGVVPDVVVREPVSLAMGLPDESFSPAIFGFHPQDDPDIQAALKVLRGTQRELTRR